MRRTRRRTLVQASAGSSGIQAFNVFRLRWTSSNRRKWSETASGFIESPWRLGGGAEDFQTWNPSPLLPPFETDYSIEPPARLPSSEMWPELDMGPALSEPNWIQIHTMRFCSLTLWPTALAIVSTRRICFCWAAFYGRGKCSAFVFLSSHPSCFCSSIEPWGRREKYMDVWQQGSNLVPVCKFKGLHS